MQTECDRLVRRGERKQKRRKKNAVGKPKRCFGEEDPIWQRGRRKAMLDRNPAVLNKWIHCYLLRYLYIKY